jgi:branched-chain amino acid transport system permease protein
MLNAKWADAIGWLLLFILFGLAISSGDTYTLKVVTWVSLNILAAAALRFVMLTGELNIATAAFWGIGAYAAAILTVWFKVPFFVAIIVGGIVPLIVSVLFGYVTLGTKGPYFMLISFAFTEVLRLIYTQTESIGGNSGMIGIYPPRWLDPYYAALVVAVVIALLAIFFRLEKGAFGKLLKAIQNNDAVAESVGINVLWTKIICLAIASFAAGVGGSLFAHGNRVISPGDFSFLLAVYALAYVKIGGETQFSGPIIGATVLTLLNQYVISYGHYEHIFFGGAIVLAMLALPNGLMGLVEQLLSLAGLTRNASTSKRGNDH